MTPPSQPSSPKVNRRKQALRTIEAAVCQDRCKTHGDAEDNFALIADLWTSWLKGRGNPQVLNAQDAAAMQGLVKVARAAGNVNYLDHWVDLGGYAVCGAGIVIRETEGEPAAAVATQLTGELQQRIAAVRAATPGV